MWKKNRQQERECQKCKQEFVGYWNRKWCNKCLIFSSRERALKSYYKHHEKAKERGRKYHHKFVEEKFIKPDIYKKWRQQRTKYGKKYNKKVRIIVLQRYGGLLPKCLCCGENKIEFLTIDHIKNDGAKHRKEIKQTLYQWLYKKKFMPDRFQVLCVNCNYAKQWYGKCPHQN